MLAAILIYFLYFFLLTATGMLGPDEPRYAAIGREMARSGDWVTPRLYMSGELVPFWAKPPLFFWTTALSFGAFGPTEWAARFPNFLVLEPERSG